MELKRVKCTICGEPLNEAIDGIYKCDCCNSTFKEETTNKEIEIIITLLDDNKQEQLANARKNLYNITHNEEYLSKERIREAVNRVKELYPDDIMANFYDSFLLDKDATNRYLLNFDVEKNKDYLKPIIEFTIKNLELSNTLYLTDLINKAYLNDVESKNKYITLLEQESEKLNSLTYNLDTNRDVFVCYSSKDMNKVNEIADFIERNKFSCFVAARNLRHGIGSVENYGEAIKKAMRNCKCFLYLSSKNSRDQSCDALKYELPYLKETLINKPRIQYIIENQDPSCENIAVLDLINKQIFNGHSWCTSLEDLNTRLTDFIYSNKKQSDEKYCVNCFEKNPLSAKHCLKCDCEEFVSTYEEALKINNDRKAEAYRKQLEEEYKKKQEELERIKREQETKEFKYCVSCRSKNPIAARFCLECGKPEFVSTLEEINNRSQLEDENYKYCVSCRTKNLKTAKFCCECGKSEFLPTLEAIDEKKKEEELARIKAEEELKNYKYCTKCFTKNASANKFCQECGSSSFESTLLQAKQARFKKGSIVTFGNYPQSTDTPEPIEWDVLDVVDGKALLFAHKILDAHRFASSSNNYANSEIRKWLNNEFLNKAFTKEEQERILVTEVDNSERSTNPYNNPTRWGNGKNKYACENTQDKIFLLSEYEITNPNYGFNEDPDNKDIKRRKQVTEYAKKNGAWVNTDNTEYKGNGWYFLRSPSFNDAILAYFVIYGGYSYVYNNVFNTDDGAVPALWIKI